MTQHGYKEGAFIERVNALARSLGLVHFKMYADHLEYEEDELTIKSFALTSTGVGMVDFCKAPGRPIERLYLMSIIEKGAAEFDFTDKAALAAADFFGVEWNSGMTGRHAFVDGLHFAHHIQVAWKLEYLQ